MKKKFVISLFIFTTISLIIIFYLFLKYGENDYSKSGETTNNITFARNRTHFASNDGFYYIGDGFLLNFFDFTSRETILVCNKPQCKHQPWDENTPKEERCDAYISNCNTIFVHNNRLYIIKSDSLELSLYSSELDRSDEILVYNFGVNVLDRFFIKNDKMYYSNLIPEETKDEAGFPIYTGKQTNFISELDLRTKKVKQLTDPQTGNTSSISMLAMEDTIIYYKYYYFENPLDADNSNWNEAKLHTEYYSYDLNTKEKKIFYISDKPGELVVIQKILNNKLYYATYNEEFDTLYCYDNNTKQVNQIFDEIYGSIIYDNKVFYSLKSGEDFIPYYYDLITGDSKKLQNNNALVIDESTDGLLLSVTDNVNGSNNRLCYITKEDYYNNKFNVFYLN